MAINIKPSHKGLLHKNLGVPQGEHIPKSKLAIKDSDSEAVRKRKQFAINASKWKHADGGLILGENMYPEGGEIQYPGSAKVKNYKDFNYKYGTDYNEKQFFGKQPLSVEQKLDAYLGHPLAKARVGANDYRHPEEDPIDNLRHSLAGRYVTEAIANKTGNIPFISKGLGVLGANALGVAHELDNFQGDSRDWKTKLRESGEDMFNNFAGSMVGGSPLNTTQKNKASMNLANKALPDGYGEVDPFRKGLTNNYTLPKHAGGGMTSPRYRYDNGKFLPMHDGTTGAGTVVGTPPATKWGANFAKANPNLTTATNMAPAAMEVANTFVNQNTDPELAGALDWGAKGAAAGSSFGPLGTIIGGTAGLIGGGVKGIFDRQTMDTANTQKQVAAKNAADFKTVMGNADTTNMGIIQANPGSRYGAFGGTTYNGRIYANGGMTVINKDHSNPQEEVEGGESAMLPSGKNVQFNGPKHTNGGIKTSLPEGTRIFSDQLIYPGKR